MSFQFAIRTRAACLCGTALVMAASSPLAAQETRGGVELRTGVEAVSNPFLNETDTNVTAAGTAEVRPWWRRESEISTFDLEGFAQLRAFASDYDLEDNYGLSARVRTRASERAEFTARASVYSSDARVVSSFGRVGIDPESPSSPTPPIGPAPGEDLTLLGARGRATTIDTGAGVEIALSARDKASFDIAFQDLSVASQAGDDYRAYSASAGLVRRLTARTSAGLNGFIRKTDYEGSRFGDATTTVGLVSVEHEFSETWTLKASAGLASTEIEATAIRAERDLVLFASEASLCGRFERRRMCLDYRRLPQPTALGGVRNSNAIGFLFDEQLSKIARLAVGANYSHTAAEASDPVAFPEISFANVRATFERALSERIDGLAFASVSRIYRRDLPTDPSVTLGVGIRIRLGGRR